MQARARPGKIDGGKPRFNCGLNRLKQKKIPEAGALSALLSCSPLLLRRVQRRVHRDFSFPFQARSPSAGISIAVCPVLARDTFRLRRFVRLPLSSDGLVNFRCDGTSTTTSFFKMSEFVEED